MNLETAVQDAKVMQDFDSTAVSRLKWVWSQLQNSSAQQNGSKSSIFLGRQVLQLALWLCTWPLFLFADPTVIESDNATYKGKTLFLEGNVSLKHDFGLLQAEKAELLEPMQEREFRHLHLCNQVHFSQNATVLKCDRLDLDAQIGEAKLWGIHEPISFTSHFQNKPVGLTSPLIEMRFNPYTHELKEMKAAEEVRATYCNHLQLQSKWALLKQSELCLTFYPPCILTSQETTRIEGTRIDLLLDKKEIHFLDPQGSLFPPKSEKPLLFSGSDLTWQEEKGQLLLSKNVRMQFASATLCNNEAVTLLLKDKKDVQVIDSQGVTKMDCEGDITLTCNGRTALDLEKKKIFLKKGKDAEQVSYKDPRGHLEADEMVLDYTLVQGKMTPVQMLFKGNVSAFNDAPFDKKDTSAIERFTLADVVIYHPEERQMILRAAPGKKVLFYDRIKKMQISADEIIASKKGTENIETRGHVRMVFNDKEAKALTERFSIHAD